MRIAVGADHAGTPLNETAIVELRRLGHEVLDLGTHDPSNPDDYSDYAAAVAEEVVSRRCDRGLLICGSGAGVSVAANKFPGIRAAMCHDITFRYALWLGGHLEKRLSEDMGGTDSEEGMSTIIEATPVVRPAVTPFSSEEQ
jgi:Ribose/Galactose Isomerase